jgi:predicted nucleotidyltransferase
MPLLLSNHREPIIQVLENFPLILLSTLFGSASRNQLRPDSDIDIGVAADRPLSAEQYLEITLELSSRLNREVDLVDLNEAKGLILSEALCSGIILFCRNTNLLSGLIRKVWMYNSDMLPHVRKILEIRNQRFVNG